MRYSLSGVGGLPSADHVSPAMSCVPYAMAHAPPPRVQALQLLCPLVGLPPFPEALVEGPLRLVACAGQGPPVGSSCID